MRAKHRDAKGFIWCQISFGFGYCKFKSVLSPPPIHCHVPLRTSFYIQLTRFNTHVCLFPVKFLEVIKPFCAVLPEIQKPERKVCIFLLDPHFTRTFVNGNTYIFCWLCFSCQLVIEMFLTNRSSSGKRYYGLPSLSSFSWCVAR